MLAYILAVLVGTGSVGLYLSAFLFPEIHRKHDFIWSGVGLFYALVLWTYARQETGGILVGQTTSVILLGWFVWQTLKLRRQLLPIGQQTPIPNPTKFQKQQASKQSASKVAKPTAKTPTSNPKPATPAKITTPATPPPATIPTIRPAVRPEAAPTERNIPAPVQQILQPVSPNPVGEDIDTVEPEAWIKLEMKPDPAPSKPLSTAVQPPTPPQPTVSHPETSSSLAIIPETITTKAPLESEQQE